MNEFSFYSFILEEIKIVLRTWAITSPIIMIMQARWMLNTDNRDPFPQSHSDNLFTLVTFAIDGV